MRPVYIVKPKYIFKHPFNKYDLSTPTNREMQNEELTDYFNYGFNEDTMNIYGKLVKRFIQVLDHRKNLEYFNEPSLLMRLNDEIPMDFGGFCKFHDPSIINTDTSEDFDDGSKLMQYFIMMIMTKGTQKIEYPLIEFIRSMYRGEETEKDEDDLFDIIEQIAKNIEKKYQETMKKLIEKTNEAKPVVKKHLPIQRQDNKEVVKTEIKKEVHEKISSESSSDDSNSSSDDSNDKDKKKKSRDKDRKSQKKSKKRDHEKDRDRDRKKKDSKDKDRKRSKEKKIKKDKHRKRSRDKSRDKNRRSRDRSKERDRKKKNH